MLFINKLFAFIITGLRPLLGPACCKYPIGCTDFALDQLKEQPLHKALWAIVKRIASCNPLSK